MTLSRYISLNIKRERGNHNGHHSDYYYKMDFTKLTNKIFRHLNHES